MKTSVFGKCILVGEHSVLRGVPALVVPLKSRTLEIEFSKNVGSDHSLKIEAADEFSESTRLVMWGVIEKALSKTGRTFNDLSGTLKVKNGIPFGAGLGASAALCVSVARLFLDQKWITKDEVFEFARGLENIFHGDSSGVDVAVAEQGEAIKYIRGKGFEKLDIRWKPRLFLSHSGTKGVTSECVKQVQALFQKNNKLATELDQLMNDAVIDMESALTSINMSDSARVEKTVLAFDKALKCFKEWGLTKGTLDEHLKQLRAGGAWACKPTGSGGGGHVLSFWKDVPPSIEGVQFLPLEF